MKPRILVTIPILLVLMNKSVYGSESALEIHILHDYVSPSVVAHSNQNENAVNIYDLNGRPHIYPIIIEHEEEYDCITLNIYYSDAHTYVRDGEAFIYKKDRPESSTNEALNLNIE